MAGCPAVPGALGPCLKRIPALAAWHFPSHMTASRQFSNHRCRLPRHVHGAQSPMSLPAAKDPAASRGAQAERFGRARRQRPVKALPRLNPIKAKFWAGLRAKQAGAYLTM
jgi:hypothetical protein